jgi:hypothetical protein
MGGVRRPRWGRMRSLLARDTVRSTTRASRRESIGAPGGIRGAKASKICFAISKDLFAVGVSRYLPAARIAFSETKVCCEHH